MNQVCELLVRLAEERVEEDWERHAKLLRSHLPTDYTTHEDLESAFLSCVALIFDKYRCGSPQICRCANYIDQVVMRLQSDKEFPDKAGLVFLARLFLTESNYCFKTLHSIPYRLVC